MGLLPVTFSLASGEHLAITGASGSGKTTLLRILAGLLEPTTGEVLEDGRVVSRPGCVLAPHTRGIGMLFQGLGLWPHLNALANVELSFPRGVGSAGGRSGRLERRRKAQALLCQAGLGDLAHRYPSQLSGGERQRVAWARAVAGEPRILFLDEPLTSLDPRLRGELLDLVIRYGRSSGRTIVAVTHEADLARGLGHRVLALEKADGVSGLQSGRDVDSMTRA